MEPFAQQTQSSAVPVPAESLNSLRFPLPRKGPAPTLREQGGEALALAGIAHDARNLVTALGFCAEMISQPGVLAPRHGHFAGEIRSLAEASARLVQRLSDLPRTSAGKGDEAPVADLAEAVQQMKGLLTAIAGPVMEVQFACLPCRGQLRLTEESLSRILGNLVRNAADAMPTGGRIRITTQPGGGAGFLWALTGEADTEESAQYLWDDAPHPAGSAAHTVLLTVEDTGPGIATEFLERVFDVGFTTHGGRDSWPKPQHHGLGLSIVRQLVEEAGGTVRAVAPPLRGARFEIELPLTNVTPFLPSEPPVDDTSEPK
jgi:two-component system cell cycle sensor histidine kinase/response regulator CckA